MSFSTPVAFFIFNRPDLTEIVFNAIAQAKPSKLLVVADGPRTLQEEEKCRQTRSIIERVDWDCDVLTRYSDKNLGCGKNVSQGLDWVFKQAEEAIIVEDDALPDQSFFNFCQVLLEKYRDDARIMQMSGVNLQFGQSRTEYSYYFSKYAHGWAWATWRRAWQHYDFKMKSWPEFQAAGLLANACDNKCEEQYWGHIFNRMMSDDAVDTWDYQWVYACWSQSGLSILPNVNLVSNLGFRQDATHTIACDELVAALPTGYIKGINHPPFIIRNKEADSHTFDRSFGGVARKIADQEQGLMSDIKRQYFGLKAKLASRRPRS